MCVEEMITVLEAAFTNPNRVREATMEYRQLTMGAIEAFVDFRTRFLLFAEEAGIPEVTRRLDLYDKITTDLQILLVPVLDTLPTFSSLATRAMAVDQEQKWISQRVMKARAAKLVYG